MLGMHVLAPSVSLLVIGVVQDAITGKAGPLNLEVVAATAVLLVVGMFLWYLRWQTTQSKDALSAQTAANATARTEQAAAFEKSLQRILEHDRSNHEQAMVALREITQHQAAVANHLSQLTHRRTG